jgi:hypothetical protein
MKTTAAKTPRRAVGMLLGLALFGPALVVLGGSASAAPAFQLPFPCGQKWRLNHWGHAPAIDMVKEPQSQTNGATLVAPAAGTVNQSFFHSNAGNTIQINHGGGHFTTYLHLQSRAVGQGARVSQGTVIGRVGATGPTSNGTPHLHYEQGFDADGNGSATWGYAGSERVTATFNGISYGGSGREWRNVESKNTCAGPSGVASVYGVMGDGRLTYTAIDAGTGRRTFGAVVSAATLGLTPRALATLDFNTLLVTDTDGRLYRVDVRTNNDSLSFDPPVELGGGWTHDLLAYDGSGHLYGIAGDNDALLRYNIGATKPTAADITGRTEIGRGFSQKTLTTTGPDWILGNHADGRLISYKINGVGQWQRYDLRPSTWQVFDQLTSPGGGVYLAHKPDSSLARYVDANPYDGNGSDISSATTLDTRGWGQILLSAQPGTVN